MSSKLASGVRTKFEGLMSLKQSYLRKGVGYQWMRPYLWQNPCAWHQSIALTI